ncbi:hypothetical protein PINS_up004179 [Pythium insidiosum]|nr:hypothetical protein PINS_up004179 [Pythium insidiosum]
MIGPHSSSLSRNLSQIRERSDRSSCDAVRSRLRRALSSARSAGVLVLHVVLNSLFAIACAWLVNLIVAHGSRITGVSPATQSLVSFKAMTMGCVGLMNQLAALLLHSDILRQSRPRSAPPLLLWPVAWQILQRTWWQLLLTVGLTTVLAYALATTDTHLQPFKLHVYLCMVVVNGYTVSVQRAARAMIREEQEKERSVRDANAAVVRRKLTPTWRRMCLAHLKGMVNVLLVVFIAVYVHVASRLTLDSHALSIVFSASSIALKVAFSEVIRHWALRQKKRLRLDTISVLVAIPTVLIDTQVRLLLLRNSEQTATTTTTTSPVSLSLWSSIALAFIEISTRMCKLAVLELSVRQRQRRRRTSSVRASLERRRASAIQRRASAVASSINASGGDTWTQNARRFHAAELRADMYAEYIAIGCSMSIYFFYGQHPNFDFHIMRVEGNDASGLLVFSRSAMSVVALQIFIEMLVDVISSAIELSFNVFSTVDERSQNFQRLLFAVCAVNTINISSLMYARDL